MKWATLTNIGSREINEDSIAVIENEGCTLFVVADGLGGHGKGDIASKLATGTFEEVFRNSKEPLSNRMEEAFLRANQNIVEAQENVFEQRNMKTTTVALAIENNSVLWGHIGDSRLYNFSFGRLKTRTLDHSVTQMLVMTKEITEKEIRNHPDRNKLLRVLGIKGLEPRYEIVKAIKTNKHQAYLLCTDGFWELILESEMQKSLRQSKSPQEWLDNMEKIILERGKDRPMDNYSAIGVWLGG